LVPDSNANNDVAFSIGLPAAPTLNATAGDAQVSLSWSSVTGASSYTLKRGTVSGGPYQNLATGLATTQYTDTSAVAGTTYFYVVTAVGAGGESTPSNEANATLTASQPLTLAPSADAYVRAKNYAATNYGNAATLEIKTSKTTAENRDAYFKFDLNGIGTVTTAKLRIYASLYGTGSGTSIGTTVYSVSNTTWTENGLTWNNKPARGSGRASVNVVGTTYAWYELDVTSYIKSELAARRRIISLALHNSANSNLHIRANSKEATANRPQLVITN
jgi:hypothetical protein